VQVAFPGQFHPALVVIDDIGGFRLRDGNGFCFLLSELIGKQPANVDEGQRIAVPIVERA